MAQINYGSDEVSEDEYEPVAIRPGMTIKWDYGSQPIDPDPDYAEVLGMQIDSEGQPQIRCKHSQRAGSATVWIPYDHIVTTDYVSLIERRGDFEGFDPMRESLGGPGRDFEDDTEDGN